MDKITRQPLRIVGLSPAADLVFIQRYSAFGWLQTKISYKLFKELMIKEFPDYWEEYEQSNSTNYAEYFYNYGEESEKARIYDPYGFSAIMGADTSHETYVFR